MTSMYDAVREHHRVHGDDFGREENRAIRYDAALSMFPRTYASLLDVGSGSGRFRLWWNGSGPYTGIDLLDGTNVLDYEVEHDLVVALGVLYKVPFGEQSRLIAHMWSLAQSALVIQTITRDGRPDTDGEWPADPVWLHRFARTLTAKVALRTDYLLGDCTLGLYR